MNRLLGVLVLVVAALAVVYSPEKLLMVVYGLSAVFGLAFGLFKDRPATTDRDSWRAEWIAALFIGVMPWALGGFIWAVTGAEFHSLVIIQLGVPFGSGFCLGMFIAGVLSMYVRIPRYGRVYILCASAVLFFTAAVTFVKSPAELKQAERTPITLTAKINGKGELFDLQGVVDGKSVKCHSGIRGSMPVWCDLPGASQ